MAEFEGPTTPAHKKPKKQCHFDGYKSFKKVINVILTSRIIININMIGNKIDSVESISKYQKDDYKRDTILKDLGVLQPDKASYSSSIVLSLAKRFSQIGLSDTESLNCIAEEFNGFLLSPRHTYTRYIQCYKNYY